jgi:poly-D-alanine transfer protein DltD
VVGLALVALMIFAPAASAQQMTEEKMMTEDTTMMQPQMMDQGTMMEQQMVHKTGGGSFGGPAVILPLPLCC